jgi:hypothetical protein
VQVKRIKTVVNLDESCPRQRRQAISEIWDSKPELFSDIACLEYQKTTLVSNPKRD